MRPPTSAPVRGHRPSGRFATLLLALLAALLLPLLAACGGSSESTAPADPTPSSDPPSSSASDDPGEAAPDTPSSTPSETPSGTPSSAPPTPDKDAVPTSYDAGAALVDAAPGPARRVNRFETADGNLYCVLDSDFTPTSCELAEGAVPAPGVCSGDGASESVGRIELRGGTPRPVCNTDTIREGAARTLQEGESSSIRDLPVRCVVQPVGITCVDDEARTGFFLGRDRYEVF